MLKQLKFQKA